MAYVLSKVFWFFATPSNFFLILVVLGLLMRARWARTGYRLALTGASGLAIAGLSPFGSYLLAPLENRFPAFQRNGATIDGIVVLGGSFDTDATISRGQIALNDAGERIIALGDLARRYPQARLLYAGGGSGFNSDTTAEATLVERYIAALGVAPERVTYERSSLNTHQNAVEAKALAQPKPGERWLLVTSAFHMPRATGAFRQAGFPVIAYPTDYRTPGGDYAHDFFAFASEGLRRSDLAAKEWAGLFAYALTGRSSSFFPGPEPVAKP